MADSKKVILKGDAAVDLWLQGKEAWNDWVAQNPVADIDFSDVDFSQVEYGKYTVDDAPSERKMSFMGYKFPRGDVSFVNATFGDGGVSFYGATFDDGDVSFAGATFGDGYVSFFGATFGDGNVSFVNATFGDGTVSFYGAKFGDGDVWFNHATFGKGNVGFSKLQNVGKVKQFSFQGCTIDSQFTISSSERFGVPIDLTRTKYSHQILLSEVSCDFRAKPKKWFGQRKMAKNSLDSQRFRRLKEIALSNRNNTKAMEFHIGEIQSQRGHGTNIITDVAEWLFWLLGDYGRSVLRPLIGLGVNMFLFAIIFYDLRTIFKAQAWEGLFTALTYSGSQMLAFIPISRTAGSRGEEILFGKATPNIVIILGATESIISIILLFLLGLGLRNMFRV